MKTTELELVTDEAATPTKQLAPFDSFKREVEKLKVTAETLTVSDVNQRLTLLPYGLVHSAARNSDWRYNFGRVFYDGFFPAMVTSFSPMASKSGNGGSSLNCCTATDSRGCEIASAVLLLMGQASTVEGLRSW